jgi:hypothetical protein
VIVLRIKNKKRWYPPSAERFSFLGEFDLPSGGKANLAMENDEISTNYDSDDGWSDDSAEFLYIDERYASMTKKIIFSHLISHHYPIQQQNILLR